MPVNPFAGLQGLISPTPGVSSGAGSGALAAAGEALRRDKTSKGYLELQQGQQAWKQQQDVLGMHEKERTKRQAAMLALNQAVRTGVKADILSAAQQAKALGLEVDLDPEFLSTVKPEELAATAQGKGTTQNTINLSDQLIGPDSAGDQKLSAELDKIGSDVIGALAGPPSGPGMGMPNQTINLPDQLIGPESLAPPAAMGAPPMGPSMGMPQPPRRGYRVRDPMYGGEFEISPEQIIEEQGAAVGAAFAPAEGVDDPIYVQGRKVGAQMAQSLIGLVPLDEAIARGEKAEALYNANMLKQLGIEAAGKKSKSGGSGGGAKFGGPGKSGLQVYGTISDNVQQIISKVEQSNNYQKRDAAIGESQRLIASFDEKSGVGDRNALGQYIKSISGAATTDKERAFYESSAGMKARMENILGTWTEGGKLSPSLIRELRSLVEKTTKLAEETQRRVKEDALEAAAREVDTGVSSAGPGAEYLREKLVNSAAGRLGLPPMEAEGGTGGGGSERTRRLLQKAGR